MENKITKSDLNKVFWRTQLIQMSHNYERMQSLGSLYCLSPILKRIYKDAPKEQRVESMRRHLEYFNTHPMLAFSIFGIVAAMEENTLKTKQEILTALAHSGDDKLLLAGLLDKEQTCEQRGYLTHTKFLDLKQRALCTDAVRLAGATGHALFWGGYEDAERGIDRKSVV